MNVPNVSSKSEEFSLKDTEVLVDSEEQNWFKLAHVGKFLGFQHIDTSVEGLDKREMPARNDIKAVPHGAGGWPGPKDHQNNTDKFLSAFGVMYVIAKSQKDKGKTLMKHILKDIVPRGLDAKTEDLTSRVQALEFTNEEERQAHQQAIEGKDATIALLNDDLKNREHDNVALQAQRDLYNEQLQKCQDIITHLKKRYVPHAKDPGKDNIVMIIEKYTEPEEDEFYEYPYYVARIQRQFINTKK